jgi:hypothetical protein
MVPLWAKKPGKDDPMRVTITDTNGVTTEVTPSLPGTVTDIRELCLAWFKHKNNPAGIRPSAAILAACKVIPAGGAKYSDSYDVMVYGGAVYDGVCTLYSPSEIIRVSTELVTGFLYPRLEPSIEAVQKARGFSNPQ